MNLVTSPRTRGLVRVAAVTALAAAALSSPVSVGAAANGNPPDVECAGYSSFFKIDGIGEGGLSAGSYEDGDPGIVTNWDGQVITISNISNGGQQADWASTRTVSKVVAKEGSDEFASTAGLPGTSGSIASQVQQGLSHVTFCGNGEPEPTPTPEPEVTPTPEPDVTPTPEPEVTPTPEPVVTPTPEPVVTPTPEPTGSVAPATGTPRVTPPATDTTVTPDAGSGNPIPVLLLLGAVVATAALVSPGARVRARPR